MRSIIAWFALTLIALVSACSGGDKDAFRTVDHDKNGNVSYEELLFVFPEVTPDLFARLDLDADGILSETEYAAFLQSQDKTAAATAKPTVPDAAQAPVRPSDGKQIAVPFKGEEVLEIPAPAMEPVVKTKAEKGKKDKDTKDAKGKAENGKKAEGTTHTVQRGDNLSKIAHKYGVTVEDITKANGDMHPDTLRDGQVLNIPARP
ncbi:LysM peptidoglycan-binding domain-containing protein [Desulfovibrio aerotolerans]|uniref:LysM peptidoglycan-binding domain-containing protein n=1 Tax=Solidesulfovibrio aerotolerans TaxID=295255 RepID=A0A7C9MNE0_9BACT|nr:LysM peptidoglycan-binding domain-containing protein [Solidesulfovibrio aerotolerans]MYL82592.1 LysM peptidoglycan-binding domain-containing protein [Solidesulfovibrio aerotolerans]